MNVEQGESFVQRLQGAAQKSGACLLGLAAATIALQATPAEAAIRLPPIDRGAHTCMFLPLRDFSPRELPEVRLLVCLSP